MLISIDLKLLISNFERVRCMPKLPLCANVVCQTLKLNFDLLDSINMTLSM